MKNHFPTFLFACLFFLVANQISAQSAPSDSVYMMAQKMPEFPGGRAKVTEYLMKNVRMPQQCRDEKVGGMAVVEFVVEKDGTPSSFRVATSATEPFANNPEKLKLAKLLDEEALRLARNMPKWSPAEQDGQPVRARMRLPVKFTISF